MKNNIINIKIILPLILLSLVINIAPKLYGQNFVNAYRIGSELFDQAKDIVVDNAGNQYIIGEYSEGSFTGYVDVDPGPGTTNVLAHGDADVFIIKLDANSNLVWHYTFKGLGANRAAAIELDSKGNAVVALSFTGKLSDEFTTFSILPNGAQDVFVAKLDGNNGNLLNYNNFGGLLDDYPTDLIIGTQDDIYLTGTYRGSMTIGNATPLNSNGLSDIFVVKLDSNLNDLWSFGIGGIGVDSPNAISINSNEVVILTGLFSDQIDMDPSIAQSNFTSAGYYDLFINKYDSNGNYIDAFTTGSTSHDLINDVTVDLADNILTVGYVTGSVNFNNINVNPSGNNFTITKSDGNGNFLWIKAFDGQFIFGPSSITTDNNNNIYISGGFQGNIDLDPSSPAGNLSSSTEGNFVLKLDENGKFIWAKKLGETDYEISYLKTVVSNSDIIYTVGNFMGSHDFDNGSGTFNLSSDKNSVDFFLNICNQVPIINYPDLEKIYGDNNKNKLSKTKIYDNGIYVAGTTSKANDEIAFISKFNLLTGALEWEKKFDKDSKILDFEYNASNEEIIAVGTDGLFEEMNLAQDNKSFIVTLDKGGKCTCQKSYDQPGRESFNRIKKHKDPVDKNFPYYVLGSVNDVNVALPNGTDVTRLYNFDNKCQVKWVRQYDYLIDDEFHRGIVDLSMGNLLLLGNDSPANDGIVVEVNGSTGAVINGRKYTGTKIDFYDGVELDQKNIVLVGTDFTNNKAISILIDDTYFLKGGIVYEELDVFKEVATDGTGNIFMAAKTNNLTSPEQHILVKTEVLNSGSMTTLFSKQMDFGGSIIENPHLHINQNGDRIVYGDNRVENLSGFQNEDIYLKSTDLKFDLVCVSDVILKVNKFAPSYTKIFPKDIGLSEPPFIQNLNCSNINLNCTTMCAPVICTADFSWSSNCLDVTFTDLSTSTGNITQWSWDIDCDGNSEYSTPNPSHTFPGFGPYMVCLEITSSGGCTNKIMYQVIVEDLVDPIIICPADLYFDIPICDEGIIANYQPIPTDDCYIDRTTCSPPSGNFFPCGTTQVSCMTTDLAGNTDDCTFDVNVNCQCGQLLAPSISCTMDEKVFDFTVKLENLTGSNQNNCQVTVQTNQSGITLSNMSNVWNNDIACVTGQLTVTGNTPLNIYLDAFLDCTCNSGKDYDCTLPVVLTTPCCLEIDLEGYELCATDNMTSISIPNCQDLEDATYVEWYISDAPCANNSGILIQSLLPCDPLILDPSYHSSNICVYAIVFFGGSNPCTFVKTSEAELKLCEPPSCNIDTQEFCYTNSDIIPNVFILNFDSALLDCDYRIQWYKNGVPISGETSDTYQAPPISFTGSNLDCFIDNNEYSASIENICTTSICTATVRLYNDNADNGSIIMDPIEPQAFCPGEDASLFFNPECTSPTNMWTWHTKPIGGSYQLESNGNSSPKFNTNKLYESTYYKVESQNGVCPIDDNEEYLIEVIPPTLITSFDVTHDCNDNNVDLDLHFDPDINTSGFPSCDYTIDWYLNGILLHSGIYNTSPANYTYSSTDKEGNYEAVITNNCCQTQSYSSGMIYIPGATQVIIAGPCFRCKSQDINLEALIINEPNQICTYEWLDIDTGNSLGTGLNVTIASNIDNVEFILQCPSGCNASDSYSIKQCGTVSTIDESLFEANIYPNPTIDIINIDFQKQLQQDIEINLLSPRGKIFQRSVIKEYKSSTSISVGDYKSGFIIIEFKFKDGTRFMKKIVKID